jgi:UDP-N-acetylmuramyl pentapeptide phosphotransferase/UDP-N-acetylglucosamine-1-phosphate transferase
MTSYFLVFVVTAVASLLLIATKSWHGHFSFDGTDGVQKHHEEPTPRIGGVGISLGLAAAWFTASTEVRVVMGPMLLAGIPAFLFGVIEDVTKEVGVLARLLATMFSGVLAWYLTGVAMQNTGLPPLDWILSFLPIAVLFTAFAVGGVANAVNIIDGFNGLASGSVAIMLCAMGLIALNVGDREMATVSFIVATCALGFGAVNWPFGKIFLGDGGAYLLGFILAWVAVLIPMRNPQVNAWATILVCTYPVLEVGFSVWRRHQREGHHPGQPDKAHLHHFLHRRLTRRLFPSQSISLQNGLTSPFCWLYCLLPAGWGVVFAHNTLMLIAGFFLAIGTYSIIYFRLTRFRWLWAKPYRPGNT